MKARPVIGIATQTQEAVPGKLPPTWIMGHKYVKVITAAGGLPWLIPLMPEDEPSLRGIYDHLDGIFLTGGVDVEPAQYGQEKAAWCGQTDPARDWTEFRLIRWALAEGKPILGVCRGIQALNVACGGTLYQDLARQYQHGIRHDYFPTATEWSRDYLAHRVRVEVNTRLGRILGADEVPVNSMHHQGINVLAPGLRPTAFAPDGLIEGCEGRDGPFVVGVQWHPEELAENHHGMRRLFEAFVRAAREFHA